MKLFKIITEVTVYSLTGLLSAAVFFRHIFRSHFDSIWGGPVDGRFVAVILEHWWQVLRGKEAWLSPPFFYPLKGVLGYADTGFLNAIPYIVLRFAGVEPFTAYQIVLFFLVVLGWIGTIFFLRCCLKLRVITVLMGAFLFVFSNSLYNLPGHTQLLTVYYIPYLAIAIYVFRQHFKKRTFAGIAAGIFLAMAMPGLFYTCYYVGWFSIFFILLLAVVYCVSEIILSNGEDGWKIIARIVGNRKGLWPYVLLCAICFIPFIITFIPVLREFGGRSYQETVNTLPTFIDYVNVGSGNLFWGRPLYSVVCGINSRPMAHELTKGIPPFLLVTFFVSLIFFIRRAGCRRTAVGNGNPIRLAAVLGSTILVVWLLILKVQNFSCWWIIWKLVPGAAVIRAVFRFQHVLIFPLAVVVAIGLNQLINYIKNRISQGMKQNACFASLGVFCLLLAGEQMNTKGFSIMSKQGQYQMLNRIQPPPPGVKVFALSPVTGLKKFDFECQVDAMVIAQKYKLPTINGFSGQLPFGSEKAAALDRPEYRAYLDRWIQHYNLSNEGLYFLNLKTGAWLAAVGAGGYKKEKTP